MNSTFRNVLSVVLVLAIGVVVIILAQVAAGTNLLSPLCEIEPVPRKWLTNRPRQIIPAREVDTSWMSRANTKPVLVVTWEFATHWAGWGDNPSYSWAGYDIKREACAIDCTFSGVRGDQPRADGVLFESQPYGRQEPAFPLSKPDGQRWIHFTYETNRYFPIQGDWTNYLSHMDWKMNYEADADIQVSMACDWGYDVSQYLAPPPPKTADMFAVYVASNCAAGGAEYRTAYVRELMDYIDVDSYGLCVNNVKDDAFPRNTDSTRFARKMETFAKYKFVLAFENSNTTDYVTEKLMHAYLAGSIPVYMGAPNVEDWAIGEQSLINTADFGSPRELATFLLKVASDEELYQTYFKWKERGIPPSFQRKLDECVFAVECRVCKRLALARDHGDDLGVADNTMDRRSYMGVLLGLICVMIYALYSLRKTKARRSRNGRRTKKSSLLDA